jgi:hypothetical protein
MARRLAFSVHSITDKGELVTHLAGTPADKLPPGVADTITNPVAWQDDGTDEPSPGPPPVPPPVPPPDPVPVPAPAAPEPPPPVPPKK